MIETEKSPEKMPSKLKQHNLVSEGMVSSQFLNDDQATSKLPTNNYASPKPLGAQSYA